MSKSLPQLGAHMSIAGGYYRAPERAAEVGCDVCQIFTKSNHQWRAARITKQDVADFRASLQRCNIAQPIAHASYLINLASPSAVLWKKSVDALIREVRRASKLGLIGLVVHPGAFTTSSESQGLRQISRGLNEVCRQTHEEPTRVLLENTAGQGSNLGWQFEQLARLLEKSRHPDQLGVCFDTCHALAAGYPMATEKEYQATMRQLDKTVGLSQIRAVHLNDSKRELGSRVDRHEHIGQGHIGLDGFRFLMRDRRFRRIPMYLETPKGTDEESGQPWDTINLATLRELAGGD